MTITHRNEIRKEGTAGRVVLQLSLICVSQFCTYYTDADAAFEESGG